MPATPVPVRSSAADLEVDSALDSLELGEDADPPPARAPVTAGQTSRALAGASSRRPQRRSVQIDAQAADPETALRPSSRDLEVLDEQLVEWSANEETKGGQDVP